MKLLFTFDVIYFKRSGKFYSSDSWDFGCTAVGSGSICYMQDAVDELLRLRAAGEPMPGLCGSWREYITITSNNGYPCLITPE